MRREPLQRGGEPLPLHLLGEVCQQHLPAGRGVQGRALADPVVRGQRRGTEHLVDVDRVVAVEDRHVDRLRDLGRQPLADRTALLGDVHPHRRGPGQPDQAEAEAVFAALARLFDQTAHLQRRDQAERRRLVHSELGGELGDAGLAAAGEDLQDGHRAVDGLHRRLRPRRGPRR